ncbi:MAG: hypothetical protein ACK5MZ_11315 [Aestuariibaculum sp.]
MNHFKTIQDKLEAFIRRYYTNELLKGAILFFVIGVLYFLFTLFIEHFLWLNTTARSVLFWLFVLVECGLLVKFICMPLAKLFKLQKGIDYKEASKIIGAHFPEVSDKLLNVLQLSDSASQSELLLAGIEQKSIELKPIPFKLAINFKQSLKYLKYVAIPLLIVFFTYLSGNVDIFSDSYKRVVHYNTAYEPPAPFRFLIENNNLSAIENKAFKLVVKTLGNVVPEQVRITYNGEDYFLNPNGIGQFEYVFKQPNENITFSLSANSVVSQPYTLHVLQVPSLLGFDMVLNYPDYTQKKNEILKSTGNAVVPEGTDITWKLNTKSTTQVNFYSTDTLAFNIESKNIFELSKRVYNHFNYSIATSNGNLKDYENLGFNINVIKDEFPELKVDMKMDSLDQQTLYFKGQATDDYGLGKLQLVYYPTDNEANTNKLPITISNTNITEFISAFPDNLDIEAGISYTIYFQVFDNDMVNKPKSVKSTFFTYRKRTKEEETDKQLNEQGETIENLSKSLNKFREETKTLEELTKTQREKSQLNFNDKKKLESFLERQKQQDDMMKNFNKKLKDNIENLDAQQEDKFKKEALQKRLEENEKRLTENEKLLGELKKIQDKISKEELIDKLEKLANQNKNKKRSLEQLLELTKRFYVEQKLNKLRRDLEEQAKQQEELSNAYKEDNTKKKQDDLNKKLKDFQEQMDKLKEDTDALKKPIDIPRDKLEESEIEEQQKQASEHLEEQENKDKNKNTDTPENQNSSLQKAKQNQKKASEKMKQMAQQMQSAMAGMQSDQLQEDTETLRQILDNLLVFSFDQEALMENFSKIDVNHNKYATYLKRQYVLREHFEHIDDSLFALSLRQPSISETVNHEISELYYYIDKAMGALSDNYIYQGTSHQQFALTAANNLADFLSNTFENMQMQMSMGAGQGQKEMQLPDIIQSQEQIQEMMQRGMAESEKQGEEGKKSKDGKQKQSGEGQQGEEGKNQEYLDGLLFEIYQRQQDLRNQLQDKLTKNGVTNQEKSLLNQMEHLELELLNKGFTKQTENRMLNLKHQLLKMENATFQQEKDRHRKSETNSKNFSNTTNNALPKAREYFNTTEILNKQNLPLQPVYRKKVQTYFKQTHD